jgi:hypothetical protein
VLENRIPECVTADPCEQLDIIAEPGQAHRNVERRAAGMLLDAGGRGHDIHERFTHDGDARHGTATRARPDTRR